MSGEQDAATFGWMQYGIMEKKEMASCCMSRSETNYRTNGSWGIQTIVVEN